MKKISKLSKVSLLLAVLFGIDKILGVARQMIISRQFGLSAELDVFNAANNLPDMLFMLISGGALAIAFIPVLTEALTKEGRGKAWDLFSNILNIAFLLTAAATIIIAIFARPLVTSQLGIAPGFTEAQTVDTIRLLRLNLISTLIFSLSGLAMAGLQANQHFLLPALAPILYDVGQIFGALVLAPTEPLKFGPVRLPAFGFGVDGLVYGVIIGALLHLLIQVPGLIKYQFRWHPRVDFKESYTRKVLRLMGPRVVSMLFIQLIFLAQDNLGSRLSEGSVSALTYGWWIMQVPQTLIGTSIATAILPTLSEMFSNQQFELLKERIERAARVMITLTVPVAIVAGMVLLPVVRLFLGLDEAGTLRVANTSQIFLLGIVGHSLVELFVRSFYALQKPRVPLIGSAFTLVVFFLLGIVLSPMLEAVGIAAANTIAYTLQTLLLLILLRKTLPEPLRLGKTTLKSLLAAALGGAAAYAVVNWAPKLAGSLIGAVAAFGVGILLAALILRKDLREIADL